MNTRGAGFLTLGLAALPPIVLFAMNSADWGSDLDNIAFTYRIAIYAGLVIALAAIALSVRHARRGGSYTVSGLSIFIALGFIVWVGPDAYLDLAAALSP